MTENNLFDLLEHKGVSDDFSKLDDFSKFW